MWFVDTCTQLFCACMFVPFISSIICTPHCTPLPSLLCIFLLSLVIFAQCLYISSPPLLSTSIPSPPLPSCQIHPSPPSPFFYHSLTIPHPLPSFSSPPFPLPLLPPPPSLISFHPPSPSYSPPLNSFPPFLVHISMPPPSSPYCFPPPLSPTISAPPCEEQQVPDGDETSAGSGGEKSHESVSGRPGK